MSTATTSWRGASAIAVQPAEAMHKHPPAATERVELDRRVFVHATEQQPAGTATGVEAAALPGSVRNGCAHEPGRQARGDPHQHEESEILDDHSGRIVDDAARPEQTAAVERNEQQRLCHRTL